ncbi:DUF4345 domain-containing protein [Rhodococcus sp. (in: high G+C Gram-positive bacteria)]|uniref:DUF4345 domain-containing protein n=1 Tax=Rhodococcus sp. TaxID=1831 RepID=UPI00257EA9E3|nr:DUF4345 domain-containing protein [Rhodococcus sp. (in: high G+C Gram-positive bacteria)]MBQ9056487.1 DUF4345 domain-containing protein [Rhodococcus sp. (in: high G+C Gram-positive bacteria)]
MNRRSARPTPNERNRRRLQWTLTALAAVPLASASREILLGPQGVPGGSPDVAPTVDSALRYANVFKFAVAPVIWSQLGQLDERSPSLTYALSSIFVGALARLRSWQQRGRPHPVTVAAIAIELAAPPLLIAWQRRILPRPTQ